MLGYGSKRRDTTWLSIRLAELRVSFSQSIDSVPRRGWEDETAEEGQVRDEGPKVVSNEVLQYCGFGVKMVAEHVDGESCSGWQKRQRQTSEAL